MRVLLASIATAVCLLIPRIDMAAAQLAVLRIKVTILDADGHPRPVPRHAVLISENPSAAAPQRAVTALDGTAEIRLRPGNYTVESDRPLIFQGKAYQWAQTLDISAGRDALLELTTANAQVEAASAAAGDASTAGSEGITQAALLIDWQHSVVSIWSPTSQGSGFLIDARGLLATNQRLVGRATSVEVQLSPTLKVAARVLAIDGGKDVAILWIDPKAMASVRPMRLGYAQADKPPIADKDRVFAINTPIHDQKGLTSGRVSRVAAHSFFSDIEIDDDSLGGPLFNAAGDVIGISTRRDEKSDKDSDASRAVRIDEARSVIAEAEKKMGDGQPPSGTPLPVEPERPFEDEALIAAVKGRAGSLGAYQVAAADFDISVITPVLIYGVRHQGDRASERERGRGDRNPMEMTNSMRALDGFENWTGYVSGYPPVLMIRATPKMVESFWKSVGRVAASTQGVELPAFKQIKAGFSRMRVYCGETEVTPIHPFKIEQRVDATHAIYEGLYIFDPGAIGPHCATVKLVLYSDKAPDKPDTRLVNQKVVEQIWQDFAAYRVQLQDVR
jgi:S1-C subfamily serine protease